MHVVPAILPKDFAELTAKLELIKGVVDTVQIDIADGKFVPNKTWPYWRKPTTNNQQPTKEEEEKKRGGDQNFQELVAGKKKLPFLEDFDFEFDLMVASPREAIPDFVRIGASRIILHIESAEPDTLSSIISEWKHAVGIGLALMPSTPIEKLEPFLHEAPFVQCMGSDRVGFQGVALNEALVLPKISLLRKKYPELTISVDIGVNSKNAPRLIAAGANRLVVGSAVFGKANPAEAIRELRALLT